MDWIAGYCQQLQMHLGKMSHIDSKKGSGFGTSESIDKASYGFRETSEGLTTQLVGCWIVLLSALFPNHCKFVTLR